MCEVVCRRVLTLTSYSGKYHSTWHIAHVWAFVKHHIISMQSMSGKVSPNKKPIDYFVLECSFALIIHSLAVITLIHREHFQKTYHISFEIKSLFSFFWMEYSIYSHRKFWTITSHFWFENFEKSKIENENYERNFVRILFA